MKSAPDSSKFDGSYHILSYAIIIFDDSRRDTPCIAMTQAPHLGRSEEPGRSSGDTKDHSEPH